MQIYLYTCSAENHRLNKSGFLNNRAVVDGKLTKESSVINPYLEIAGTNLSQYNYMYIPDFHRYYFIKDVKNIYQNIWGVTAHVDVLYTYAGAIKQNKAVVDRTASGSDANLYLDDGTFITDARKYTQVINFPNSIDDTPHTILIAAGGQPVS